MRGVELAVLQPRHLAAERSEVVLSRLRQEHVAIGEEERAFDTTGLPQAPDDLERGVGLAGAGGHHQEHAALIAGDGLDHALDGDALVVARLLAVGVGVEGVVGGLLLRDVEALPGAVALPQLGG